MTSWSIKASDIQSGRAAYVYKPIKAVTKAKVRDLFASLKRHQSVTGNLRGKVVRKAHAIAGQALHYSFASFLVKRTPSFLPAGSAIKDTLHGFLLLIEVSDHLVLIHSHAPAAATLFKVLGTPIDHSIAARALETIDTAYEKLGFRNMSPSRHVVRRQVVEAEDLQDSFGLGVGSRSIPSSIRLSANGVKHTVLPSTARITTGGGRADLHVLFTWAAKIVKQIEAYTPRESYLDGFATPVLLQEVLAKTRLASILLEVHDLAEDLGQGHMRLTRDNAGVPAPLTETEVSSLIEAMGTTHLVVTTEQQGKEVLIAEISPDFKLRLAANSRVITVRSSKLQSISIQEVATGAVVETLQQYFNGGRFLANFVDPTYAYFQRSVFRDANLLTSVEALMKCVETVPELEAAKFEKFDSKKFPKSAKKFPNESVFGILESHLAGTVDLVILDDYGDEWADDIALAGGASPAITFFHEKHANRKTSGASALHEVVSQALKNLGRLYLTSEIIERKLSNWKKGSYANTRMRQLRTKHARWGSVQTLLTGLMARPDTVRRVSLVLSFVSKKKLASELNKFAKGTSKDYHLLQTLWLLSTFVGACRARGAIPAIVCCP